jgi:phosphoribosylamine--glycine ligase
MENDSKSTLRYAFVENAGTAAIATNVDVSITDFEAIKVFVLAEKVEMIVVGPEDPLVKGIYDFLNDEKLSHISYWTF